MRHTATALLLGLGLGGGCGFALGCRADASGPAQAEVTVDASVGRDSGPVSEAADDSGTEVPQTCLSRGEYTSVQAIQGNAAHSPLDGRQVTTQGVVVKVSGADAIYPGFFLRALEDDLDPHTSEGLFVFTRQADATPGDVVIVRGEVEEYFDLTELKNVEEIAVCGRSLVHDPRPISFPLADGATLESLEGMLVRFEQPLYVDDLIGLRAHGEVLVTVAERAFSAHNGVGNSLASLSAQSLVLDDGRYDAPQGLSYGRDNGDIGLGDMAFGVEGVLVEAYGAYRLHPTSDVHFVRGPERRSALPPRTQAQSIRVAGFNVGNYFVTLGDRGAANDEELERQTTKLVEAIYGLDADVVGLVEVEANGSASIAALRTALNAAHFDARPVYTYVGIATSLPTMPVFLYRSDRVIAVGDPRLLVVPDTTARPSLVQSFSVVDNDGGNAGDGTFDVVLGHFRARICDTNATGQDADLGDGQGCYNRRRTLQAETAASFLATVSSGILLGDLNAYATEDPIEALASAGLVDLVARHVPGSSRYSAAYEGEVGYIDHALATPSLAGRVTGVAFWHINADEPTFSGYRISASDLYRPDAYRSSDHDPLIVDFRL
ncbi:MAG: ExeM/NucH family extracellular endonuclease [Deltaproteobacteria bacterium]|nr:ExeM/NucH family extracellular endonuclease [Deltaproteobacteria bacterium]